MTYRIYLFKCIVVVGRQSLCLLTGLLKYLLKVWLIKSKNWDGETNCQNPFSVVLGQKNVVGPFSSRGGGGA